MILSTGTEKGYEYLDDNHAIQRSTGEVVSASMQQVITGSITYTPEQQEAYKKRKESEAKKAIQKASNKPLGRYYFANSEQRYKDLSPQTMARLIYLGTYLPYNSNVLEHKKGVPMRKGDVEKVMKLSVTTFFHFWHEVLGTYLFENEDGYVCFNDVFKRGNITKGRNHIEYQKIYIQTVRELYGKTPTSKHRYLGYIFQMLPYVNYEYNILCFTPEETDINAIIPMTVNEFCNLIGVSPEKRTRTIREYANILLPVRGNMEKFCSFVTDDLNIENMKIFINPHILYRGSDWEKVAVLGAFMMPTKSVSAGKVVG